MKKLFFSLGVLISLGSVSNAQKMIGLTAGFQNVGGDFKEVYGAGFSAGLFYKNFISDNVLLGGTLSFGSHASKETSFSSLSLIGLNGDASYVFLEEGFRPYAGLTAGYTQVSYSFTEPNIQSTSSDSRVTLGPKAGALYELSDSFSVFGEVGYNLLIAVKGKDKNGNNNVDLNAPSLNLLTVGIGAAFVFGR